MLGKKLQEKVIKDGKWQEFNKDAILVSEGFYKNGLKHGLWKYYYDTGELVIEEHFIEGRMHGTYTSFYKDGRTMAFGQYVDDSREGHFFLFDENGALLKHLLFNKNVSVKESPTSETVEEGVKSQQNVS
jgi:antitoxin component YwqK of YwqJK toxin-antitoxin module